jgi:putative phosphoesterase
LRVLVTADTHVPDFAKRLPSALLREARRADLVIHAGDATIPAVLDTLAEEASVVAVRGNNDGPDVARWGAPDEALLELDGVTTAVLHDAGPRKGRVRRMRRRFPDARLVLFGHSHIPLDEDDGDLRLVNPGSPTWKRREPEPTYAVLHIARGRVRVELVSFVPRRDGG